MRAPQPALGRLTPEPSTPCARDPHATSVSWLLHGSTGQRGHERVRLCAPRAVPLRRSRQGKQSGSAARWGTSIQPPRRLTADTRPSCIIHTRSIGSQLISGGFRGSGFGVPGAPRSGVPFVSLVVRIAAAMYTVEEGPCCRFCLDESRPHGLVSPCQVSDCGPYLRAAVSSPMYQGRSASVRATGT